MNTLETIEIKEKIKKVEQITVKIKKKKNTPSKYKKKPLWRNPDIKDILYFD